MKTQLIRDALIKALGALNREDQHLLIHDLSERCIASRLALHLQREFSTYYVDVEYNRTGSEAKRLGLPESCVNARDEDGRALVVLDIIVHRRGPEGPNLLVVEIKKVGNPEGIECDRLRVEAFVRQLGYRGGAVIECKTRSGAGSSAWLGFWCQEPEKVWFVPHVDLARCPECGQGFPAPMNSRWHVLMGPLGGPGRGSYYQLPLCPRCEGMRGPEDG